MANRGDVSEHDLPLHVPPCEWLLCLRSAVGVAPTLEGEASAWLQVGMSSTIEPENFERPTLTLIAADDGIGLTVMGVGLGLGQEVLDHMVHLRGGNAFSLFDPGDVDELMADSWPWMVSPIAYDLAVSLVPSDGFVVADAYGFPGDDEQEAGFEVATVFLSRRKGALLVRMVRPGSDDLAGLRVDGRLDYETLEGLEVGQDLVSGYRGQPTDERGTWFEQHGVGKAVALAVLVDGMRRAAEAYGRDQEETVGLMEAVVARFAEDVQALADASLEPELDLARELIELMRAGAEQGDMYPGY